MIVPKYGTHRAGANHPRTPRPEGGAPGGERAACGNKRPYIDVKGHTQAKVPHAGKWPMKVKGPTEVKGLTEVELWWSTNLSLISHFQNDGSTLNVVDLYT